MTEAAARDRIRAVVGDMAPLKGEAVEGGSRLQMDLGYDSLGLLELAQALEHEFGLPPVLEDDAEEIETVADVERVVLRMLGERAAAG